MTDSPEGLIADVEDLAAALGCADSLSIDDLIADRVELSDAVEPEDVGDDGLRMVIFGLGENYSIDLVYPFPLDTFHDEVARADAFFDACARAMEFDDEDATLGVVGAPDDRTTLLATMLCTQPDALADVLGGSWQRFELDSRQGAEGETIFAWFVPDGPTMVALGIAADGLFVCPLLGSDEEGFWVTEWPEMTLVFGVSVHSDPDQLAEFSDALALATPTAAAVKVESRAHDVRLSTSNLRVASIDLDFEVKQGRSVLGTLSISQGGLVWRPSRAHRRSGKAKAGIKITWHEFKTWAESEPE